MENSPVTSETQAGINIRPGSSDDGWEAPPSVALDDGTSVQLYKDGEALQAAYRAIDQAKHRVCLESYIVASDDTGRAFAELLCRKASEGVIVYVIYDSFGSMGSDRQMFDQMRRAGVRVQQLHPIRPWECRFSWRPANRDHRKLIVIDNDIAGMGGLNIGAEYAGSWALGSSGGGKAATEFWRDTAFGLRGPGARFLLRCFTKTWHYCTHGGRIGTTEFDYGTESLGQTFNGNDLSILASVPSRSSRIRSILHTIFSQAQSSIEMTMAYFAPDDDLVDTLVRAAQRGVKVRLMFPARTDVRVLMIAARSFYEKLLAAGIEIYERQAVVLHAKTMVIDRRLSVVGSLNLDYRSIEYNMELSAIIRSRALGEQMHTLFDNDVRYANRITPTEWRRRPVLDRAVQWAVSRARYLL
jgi:cardiolipin synthase A/B